MYTMVWNFVPCQAKWSKRIILKNYRNSIPLDINNVPFPCCFSFLFQPPINHRHHASKCQHSTKSVTFQSKTKTRHGLRFWTLTHTRRVHWYVMLKLKFINQPIRLTSPTMSRVFHVLLSFWFLYYVNLYTTTRHC